LVFGIIIGFFVFSEKPTIHNFIGIFCILLSLCLLSFYKYKKIKNNNRG
jgi:drug/metabolite transporter (DMT)-like permease